MENRMTFTELDEPRREIHRLISKLFIDLETADRQLMGRFNLSVTQYWALVHLKDPEGLALSELAQLLMRDKSNMTSLVDRLEKEGLARRKHGKNGDRRFTRVALTEKGQRLRSQVMAAHAYLVRRRFERLLDEQLCELRTLLQGLSDEIQFQYKHDEVSRFIEEAIPQRVAPQK
jgi:DNA-binding MarR family transcriptional regulator